MSYGKFSNDPDRISDCNGKCGARLKWRDSNPPEYKDDGSVKRVPYEVDNTGALLQRHKCPNWQSLGKGKNTSNSSSGGGGRYQAPPQQPSVIEPQIAELASKLDGLKMDLEGAIMRIIALERKQTPLT